MTRADLSPGLQAAQSAHAAFQFAQQHPDITRSWHDGSNCLVLLAVPDEPRLLELAGVVHRAGVDHALVVEPDLGDAHTAVAVAPSDLARSFAHLPLLGREVAVS